MGCGTYSYLCHFHGGMAGRVAIRIRTNPVRGTTATTFAFRYGSLTAPSPFVYVLQRLAPGATRWVSYPATTSPTRGFRTSTKGTWRFRAYLRNTRTARNSGLSPVLAITVG